MSGKAYVTRIEIHDEAMKAWAASPEMRQILKPTADQLYEAIPSSDAVGENQTNGRYRSKFIDNDAVANDGRVAIDVGVEGADHGFFRLMTLQRAVRAIGARVRRGSVS